MAQYQSLEDIVYDNLQHNLHWFQEKYEYFKERQDLSLYPDKVTAYHDCYKLIEEDTNQFVSLVKDGKVEEAKSFYYTTYHKDFEAMFPVMKFFSLKSMVQ